MPGYPRTVNIKPYNWLTAGGWRLSGTDDWPTDALRASYETARCLLRRSNCTSTTSSRLSVR